MPRKRLPRGIDQRGDTYRARIYWHGFQHTIGHFFTIGDAQAALSIARSEIARGIFIPPSVRKRQALDDAELEAVNALTVASWADDWIARLESLGRSKGTTRSYRSTLDVHILPVIGDRRVIDVTRQDIDALIAEAQQQRRPWANIARTLRALFTAAVSAEAGGLTQSPVHVRIPKERKVDDGDSTATPAQVRALADAMPEHLRIAVPLAAWCALRLGEALGLQRRDFEHLDAPDRAVLHVRRQWHSKSTPPAYAPPKRGSARTVAIPAALLPSLREHLQQHAGTGREGPLMPGARNPAAPVAQSSFDRFWRTAREQVGMPRFRFHDLRHTGLTEYARAGATLDELMRRGGHTNVDAALRYQHASAERDRALTDKLSITDD